MSNRITLFSLVTGLALGCAANIDDDLGTDYAALNVCAGATDAAAAGVCPGEVTYDSGEVPHTSYGNAWPAGGYTASDLLEGDWSLIACSCEDTLKDMCHRRSPGTATTCRLGDVDPGAASETCTATSTYYVVGNYSCTYASPSDVPTDRDHDYAADPACTAYPHGAQVPQGGWAFAGTCRITCAGTCRPDRASVIIEDPEDPEHPGDPEVHGEGEEPPHPEHPGAGG